MISSIETSPTSATAIWPVARSKENRQGLRRPTAMTSGAGAATSRRITLPSSDAGSCALAGLAPSPVASHSLPSGPNWIWPPLWLLAMSWRIASRTRALAGSATSGSEVERRYSRICSSPSPVEAAAAVAVM